MTAPGSFEDRSMERSPGAILRHPPRVENVFPGRWRVALDAFGHGTATYDLELRSLAYFPVKNGRAK